jgi:hypothetical protein
VSPHSQSERQPEDATAHIQEKPRSPWKTESPQKPRRW